LVKAAASVRLPVRFRVSPEPMLIVPAASTSTRRALEKLPVTVRLPPSSVRLPAPPRLVSAPTDSVPPWMVVPPV
jgi:hypothetical protein